MSLRVSLSWLYREFGLASLAGCGRDVYLVILGRTCRMFAFGSASLVIALFFSSIGLTDYQIGLFMTLTLVGDVVLLLAVSMAADWIGRRRILFGGAVLMVLSGTVFATSENFWVLLVAAVLGIISATGGDFGPFRTIEESTLSHLTTPETRSDVLVWYITVSNLGTAAGTGFAGRLVDALRERLGWAERHAFHAVFAVYIVMGLISMLLACLMSEQCEAGRRHGRGEDETAAQVQALLGNGSETGEGEGAEEIEAPTKGRAGRPAPRLAQISPETRSVMYGLWLMLSLDSFADSMVPLSLTNYYMARKFPSLTRATLGVIMSASFTLQCVMTVFAGPLARRLGLISTMVFTHLPSSAAVALFPLPQELVGTVLLLAVRMGLNNMDQAPRAALIAAVVRPEERTAVMGITGALRTVASTVGPSVTGVLAGSDRFWIAFVAAGILRMCYDLGLFAMFVNIRLHKHEEGGGAQRRAHERVVRGEAEAEVEVEGGVGGAGGRGGQSLAG